MQHLLNDTVTIEKPTATRDSSGGATRAWSTRYADIAGSVQETSATQRIQYLMLQIQVSHTLYTQQSGITNGDRISWGGRYFLINGVEKAHFQGSSIDDFFVITANETRPGS